MKKYQLPYREVKVKSDLAVDGRKITKHLQIEKRILDYVQGYENLRFYNKSVVAPYYINTKKRKDLRVLVGKGTPEEMIIETKVWAQVKKLNLKQTNPQEIRNLMLQVGIGIDCSGLVSHTYNDYFRNKYKRSFFKQFRYNRKTFRGWLARLLRPAENLNANDMTNAVNCESITDFNNVLPGDLIRGIGKQRNAYHVALVTDVFQDEKGVFRIDYVHSHREYGSGNGFRRGYVLINRKSNDLLAQDWVDFGNDGINYLLEDLKQEPEDCGFRRLRFLLLAQ